VLGLSRSEEKAAALAAKRADVLRSTLDDLDHFAEAARNADAVIHLAFNDDFSKYAENSEQDRRAIEAMGEALVGTDKSILVTTGLASLAPGRIATEADMLPLSDPNYPGKTEAAAAALAARGVGVGAIRLATTVHGIGDRFNVALGEARVREGRVGPYRDGANRWPADARVGRGAALSPGAGSGGAGARLPCMCGGGGRRPCDRRGDRTRARPACRAAPAGAFRLARQLRRGRRTRVERTHARAYRLEAYWADTARRPRAAELFCRLSGDTTMDFMIADPANADKRCLTGFEAFWRMLA
jgi:hypothetical protein